MTVHLSCCRWLVLVCWWLPLRPALALSPVLSNVANCLSAHLIFFTLCSRNQSTVLMLKCHCSADRAREIAIYLSFFQNNQTVNWNFFIISTFTKSCVSDGKSTVSLISFVIKMLFCLKNLINFFFKKHLQQNIRFHLQIFFFKYGCGRYNFSLLDGSPITPFSLPLSFRNG